MPEPIISIRGLSHRYATRAVLDTLDLDIDAGTAVAVLGRNGSGKTTLFRIISTLIPPTDGTVRILNGDVVADRQRIRESLGVVFQSPSLDRMLSVEENLRHHGHLYRLSGKTLADRIDEMLERFSLTDRRRERVDRLSGGLRRRVELAKGLLTHPDLLLLDEPSTGLDPAAQAELWQQLCLIRDAGVTLLLTTHHMMEADICDRVLILEGGRIHADGSPDALKAQIGGDVVTISGSGIIEMKPDVDAHLGHSTQAIGGTLRFNTPSARRVIVPLMELLGDRAASVSVAKPSLQDVFMQMTGKTLSADDAS